MYEDLICKARIISDENILPAIEINSPNNAEDIYSARKYAMLHLKKYEIFLSLAAVVFSVISAAFGYILPALLSAAVFIMTILPFFMLKPIIRRTVKNELLCDSFRIFSFYDGHFTVKTQNQAIYIMYSDLKQVKETVSHFFFCLPDAAIYTLAKKDLSDNGTALKKFLDGKVKII